MSTEATLGHHLQAVSEGVDAIMQDYTPDSVLFTPDGLLRGLEPIRAFFDGFLRTSPPELLRAITLVRQDIEGDVAYIIWKAEPFIPLATDTFVIRDGKIVAQSFAVLAPTPVPAGPPAGTAAGSA
jgi:SnoaL-like protein